MKNMFKSYSFWTALSGAIVLLVESIGRAVGFIPNGDIINDIIMAIAGVLVVFGVVSAPNKNKEEIEVIPKDDDNENDKIK